MRLALGLGLLLTACVEPALPSDSEVATVVDAGPFVCSPRTCTGCCLNNVCVGGNEDSACGYDGRACKACNEGTRCESPGACYALPSDGGQPIKPLPPDAGIYLSPQNLRKCQFFLGTWLC